MDTRERSATGVETKVTVLDSREPPGSPAERLAAEYIARVSGGEVLDVEAFAAQLSDETERAALRSLIEESLRIQGLLPSQVRPGVLLKKRYRLRREIGSGGMGKVFEAVDTELERFVAVKVLAAIGAQAFDPEQAFRKEALVLASLQHPNIVAVHEVATEGDITFLVMDLVQGTAASEVLSRVAAGLRSRGSDPPRRGWLLRQAIGLPAPSGRASLIDDDDWFRSVARIVLQIARTLQEAHGKGVVHRDVKPHNILLRGDGAPVILDFGLAGRLGSGDHGSITRGLFGTLGYLAPEQASSSCIGADQRTDVYQLGLLLYEFLTLQRAFQGDEISGLLGRISKGEFRRPRALDKGIPFELEAICLKAMELDPGRRYPTAQELGDDLERWVEGSELPRAARGGAIAAAARSSRYWARRHKPLVAVASTVLVALAGIGAVQWLTPGPDPVVRAFRFTQGPDPTQDQIEFYPKADTVRAGDILGVTLDADTPQHVYAVSVFGDRDPPSYMAPMVLTVLRHGDGTPLLDSEIDAARNPPDDAASIAAAPSGWDIVVEPGWMMTCTTIGKESPPDSYEGLYIFTSPEPRKDLVDWMKRMYELAQVLPNKALPYADALAMLDNKSSGSVPRGGIVVPTPEQKARIAHSVTAAHFKNGDDWPLADPLRTSFFFRVER
jgi:hypothetical protein